MNELRTTDYFEKWLHALKDTRARNIILARLRRAIVDDFGDCGPVGQGASEMRIHYGAGYRIYFFRQAHKIYILLGGGTKRHQKADIEKMIAIMNQIKNGLDL